MEELLSVTKSVGDDVSVPMATTRESADAMEGESGKLPIGLWRCSGLSRGDSFMFSLVIQIVLYTDSV